MWTMKRDWTEPTGACKICTRLHLFLAHYFRRRVRLSCERRSKQNKIRVWESENPHRTRKMSRNSAKVIVECAISVPRVIWPYYFDDPIMDGESYLRLLSQYSLPMLSTLSENTIFQQDGAPARFSSQVWQLSDTSLSGSWTGRGSPLPGHLAHQTSSLSTLSCRDLQNTRFTALLTIVRRS